MTKENEKSPSLDGSEPPILEAGDFVYLAVEWSEPPDRGSPFSDSVGLLLGSGRYPVIERTLINASPTTQESYLIATKDTTEQVVPAPTLEDVFDQQTANLLNELGFSSTGAFLTADLSGVTSLPVDHDRLLEMRESLSESLNDQELVIISIEKVYRWRDIGDFEKEMTEAKGTATVAGTSIERGTESRVGWPSEWPTLGANFRRSGAYNSGQVGSMDGTVRWTQGDTGTHVDAAPMIMDGKVYVWTNRGILALDATSGDEVWSKRHPNLTGSATGWPFTPQSPIGADGRVYTAPQLVEYDAETGERRQIGQFSINARMSIADGQLLIADDDYTLRIIPLNGSDEEIVVEETDDPEDRYVPAYSRTHDMAFVTDQHGSLCAVDVETGSIEWRASRTGAFRAPSIGSHAYAVSSEQILDAIDIVSGDRLWREDITHYPISDPAVTEEHVYVATPEGIYGIDSDSGETVFEYTIENDASDINVSFTDAPPRPTIVRNSLPYQIFMAAGDTLYAISSSREECVWKYVFESPIITQPVYANGRIYLRTVDGCIHAIE